MSDRSSAELGTSARVTPVSTPTDRTAFLELPRRLRRGDPIWVEPLRYDQRRLIDPSHPFYDQGRAAEAAYFLARDATGKVVGRIGAILNHLHNSHAGVREGFFGFFESADDQGVADALLDQAAGWLRARGLDTMLGPASPSHNYEYGLLIDGFDRPHRFLLSHNPPYYQRLLESWGLTKARDLYALPIDLTDPKLRETVERDGGRMEAIARQRLPDVTVRPADLKHFAREVRIAVDLVNRSLENNWGYSPMTEGELKETAEMLRYLVDPQLLLIASRGDEPVAVSLAIPDLNLLIRKLKLRWGMLELGELFARYKLGRPDTARAIAVGVARDRAAAGLGTLLMFQVYRRALARGIRHFDASWILEDNVQMLLPLQRFGLRPDRTYRIYQKALHGI